ncbi:MAG: sigma-70 family RNA polymerase sigma factor [Acidobacteria bacterium]|nr:sigma-70 family RNA polymerase sigma factor [Acidobacteriota bacterium]
MSKPSRVGAEVVMASGEVALRSTETLAAGPSAESGLLEQCRRGDAQAFARLVAIHEAMVYNLAVRILGDTEEARDLAQDVFLQVYRTLGRFEGRSTLKTWIYRIVVNQCRNRQRWWRRRRRDRSCPIEDLSPADEARVQSGAEPDGPYEAVERRERTRRVQEALLGLSFDHRAILLLREVECLSCEDIGEALGVPEGTVKSRLARAREALRQRLAPLLDGEGRT